MGDRIPENGLHHLDKEIITESAHSLNGVR